MARKTVDELIREARETGAMRLDLRARKLTELPAEIGQLTGLQQLSLHSNHLTELPAEIGQLAGLQKLDLQGTHLTELPAEIGQLAELQELSLHGTRLTELPAEVGHLTGLQTLYLSGNQLTELPAEIGQLTVLQELHLRSNQLTELPADIGQLTGLRTLVISHNQLTELPAEIGQLTGLQELRITGNKLTELPTVIGRLAGLQVLYLGINGLATIPVEIGQLTELKYLSFHGNKLTKLPAEIQNLTELKTLYLHGNDALGIPPEVLGPAWQRVSTANPAANPAGILDYYFNSRTEASSPLLEAKLLILGQGEVGKTSLVKQLAHGTFDPGEAKTDGIEIEPWQRPGKDDQEIRVNIWDFGGQEIMHATHQFFLTKRSLYVVVLSARKGENENNIFYWLRIIESYGGGSPVLVVTNKCEGTNKLDLDERRLRKDYPSIQGFFETSCKVGKGIDELKAAIDEQIGSLGHVYDRVPNSFLETKADLEEQTGRTDFLEVREYRGICKEHGVEDAEEQNRLLRFLHDLGGVLHFDDQGSLYRLDETKILNPRWVTNGVYRILNDPELTEKGGALDVRDIDRILTRKAGYPKQARLFILGMMKKFELCYLGYQKPERYLVPELLPKSEPELNINNSDALRFEYHYELLPDGVLPRFIVRMHPHLEEELVWKRGAVLVIDGNEALVRADIQTGRVFVSVYGDPGGRRRALTAIRAEFRAIHQTIPGLQGEERVPLPKEPGRTVSYQHLLRLEELGSREFLPEGAENMCAVSELLDGIETPEDRMERQIDPFLSQIADALMRHVEEQRARSPETEQSRELDEAEEVAAAARKGEGNKVVEYLKRGGKKTYREIKDVITGALAGYMTNMTRGT